MNSLGITKHQQNETFRNVWSRLVLGFCLGGWIAVNPLVAAARAGTIWRGTGQIVSGQGHGARLQLVVETDRGRIRTRSGPALDASFSGGSGTFENNEGTWQIDRRGERLNITLYRGQQVIRYQLSPDSKGGSSPQTTVDKSLGVNLGIPDSLGSTAAESSMNEPNWKPEWGATESKLESRATPPTGSSAFL